MKLDSTYQLKLFAAYRRRVRLTSCTLHFLTSLLSWQHLGYDGINVAYCVPVSAATNLGRRAVDSYVLGMEWLSLIV